MLHQRRKSLWVHCAWGCSLLGALLPLALPLAWFAIRPAGLPATVDASFRNFLWVSSAPLVLCALGVILFSERRVRAAAERDELTGLLNQNGFARTTKLLLELCARYQEPLSVLMMDLDHFKTVNDTNNHLVGSHVIKEVGKLIANNTRKSDVCARFGGDEYVVCLPKTTAKEAQLVAERIRGRLAAEVFHYKHYKVQVTVSIGAATIQGIADLDKLLEGADAALYRAKADGRNRVEATGYVEEPVSLLDRAS